MAYDRVESVKSGIPGWVWHQFGIRSGGARVGVRLFFRSISSLEVRDPQECREEDPGRPSTGRDRPVHRLSLALGIRIGVLYARRGAREGRRRGRGWPVPAELPGSGAERAEPGRAEPASGGWVGGGTEPGDYGPHAEHWCSDDR